MFSIITLATSDMSGILGYAGELVGDFMPLLIVVIGISIGLWVINAILHRGD